MTLPDGAEVLADPDAVARAAAEAILAACAKPGRIGLCLSGGSTPRRLYALLAAPGFAERVPWERLHLFFGDERVAPPDGPDSNLRMVREALLDHAPVPPANVHPIPVEGGGREGAARYQAALEAWYGAGVLDPARPLFDLVLLGLGSDGHTASLFPGKPEVAETTRWVVEVPEPGLKPLVPRVSLTVPALSSCRTLLFLVTGEDKRAPLSRLAAGEKLPASLPRAKGETRWLLDQAAPGR